MKYKLKDKKVWAGTHDGIGFEIQHWTTPPNSIDDFTRKHWTYYIYLHLERIPEQHDPNSFWLTGIKSGRHVFYRYYNHPVLGSIFFHGGCTWYSKEDGFDDSPKVINVGCDYQHYLDEGVTYTLEDVLSDVVSTIEDFKSKVSGYKYWCCGNGKLYDLVDGIIKDESFYSEEYYGDKDWYKEYKQTYQNAAP